MRIKVTKIAEDHYRADPVDIPGSPINGIGKNKYEALGSLLACNEYFPHRKEYVFGQEIEIIEDE